MTAAEDPGFELASGEWARMRRDLMEATVAWAHPLAAGGALEVAAPDLPGAVADAFASGTGPVLVLAADAPRLSATHAGWALGDLEAGAAASFGPGMSGGWYLVALARPHEELSELLGEPLDGPDVMGRALAIAAGAHLELGLLRMERLLRTAQDAAALRADPLTPAPVRTALARMG